MNRITVEIEIDATPHEMRLNAWRMLRALEAAGDDVAGQMLSLAMQVSPAWVTEEGPEQHPGDLDAATDF